MITKGDRYSTVLLKASLALITLALATVAMTIEQGSQHFYAISYLILLGCLTFIPWHIIKKQGFSTMTAFFLFPVIYASLDIFFFRMGIHNIYAYLDGSFFLFPWMSPESIRKAMVIALLANLFMWLGFFWPVSRKIGERLKKKISKWTSFEVRPRVRLIWAFFFTGILTRLYMIKAGFGGYFTTSEILIEARPYVQFFNITAELSTLSLVAYFCIQLTERRPKWFAFYIMLLTEIVTYSFIGFKGQIFYRFLYLAVAYVFSKKRFPTKFIIIGLLALFLITPVNLKAREAFWQGKIRVGNIGDIGKSYTATASEAYNISSLKETFSDFFEFTIRSSAQLRNVVMGIDYEDKVGAGFYGQHYLHLFIWPIPRAIWPSKPVIDSTWFYARVEGGIEGQSSSSAGVVGDIYINFRAAGVLIIFFLIGLLQRVFTTSLIDTRTMRVIPVIPFIFFTLTFLHSDLGPFFAGAMRNTIFMLIALSLMFPRVRHSTQLPTRMIDSKVSDS